jgi:quercetin dioxygenase-like cupin family protein
MIKPRRIVTGINEAGRSEIFLDDVMEPSIDLGGNYFIELWNSSPEPLEPSKKNYPDLEPVVLSPGKGEVKIRYFQIPPRNENYSPEEIENFFAHAFEVIGASHERTDTKKHPGMHATQTLDYIIVMQGDVSLILDDDEVALKPFDVVVQRATSHAWSVNGDEPGLFIAVLIDKEVN